MNIGPLIVAAGLLVAPPVLAEYQKPVTLEIHIGPAASSADITNFDVDDGGNLGATVAYYHFLDKRLGAYAGFEIDAFDTDSVDDTEVSATLLYGYNLGVAYRGEIENSKLGYFARVGTHVSKLQLIDDDDDEVDETKFDAGLETSVGLTYRLGENWALRGGVRYKTFSRRLKGSGSSGSAELDSTTLLLGAQFYF